MACGFSNACNDFCSYFLQYLQLVSEVNKDNEATVCSGWTGIGTLLNIFIHIPIYSNIQIYILQYHHDGIQKEVMRLIQICFPLNIMVHSLKIYPVKINKNMSCIQTK